MSVFWKYTAQDSVNLWNWTHIAPLELRYMGVDNFLRIYIKLNPTLIFEDPPPFNKQI